jgi:hypothetical protein
MHTSPKQPSVSWYDTPLGRLAERAGHRRPRPSVAEVVARLTAPP